MIGPWFGAAFATLQDEQRAKLSVEDARELVRMAWDWAHVQHQWNHTATGPFATCEEHRCRLVREAWAAVRPEPPTPEGSRS